MTDAPTPRRRRRLLPALLLGLPLAYVLVVEVGLRVLAPAGLSPADLAPDLEAIQEAAYTQGHSYLAYALKPDWSSVDHPRSSPWTQKSHDAHGLRNPAHPPAKPEGVFRIACLGGSSTYGTQPSSDAATWPARLERHLNEAQGRPVEVLNFGCPGYSTFESVVNLAFRVPEYEPDLVIVYHAINDMRCALYLNGGPVQPDNQHWRALWAQLVPAPGEELLEHSMGYLLWRKRFTGYLERARSLDAWAIVNYDAADPDPYEVGELDPTGFRSFERNLESLVALGRARGARMLLATQGCDLRDITPNPRPGNPHSSRENQLEGLDYCAALTRGVAERQGTLFVDARPVLDAEAARVNAAADPLQARFDRLKRGDDPAAAREALRAWYEVGVYTNEVHLTDHGADLLARTFADAILAADVLGGD